MLQAVTLCRVALALVNRDSQPERWVALQSGLGDSLYQNPLGGRAENLEQAIDHYNQALEVYSRQDFPEQWATIQNNLANAYRNRIRGNRAQNIEEAIEHYELALEVRTRRAFPEDWAATQNNLVNAYNDRIRGDRAQNIEEAIEHYELVLKVRTPTTFPQDCRNTAYSLGNLLYDERRFTEARTQFTTAHEAVEALRGEIQRQGGRRDLAEQNTFLYARLVHCCLLGSDERAAFEYAAAGKGWAFVDMLATARFDLTTAGADDPELAEDLRKARELRQQIDNLLAQLGGEATLSTRDGTERRSPSEMYADLPALQDQDADLWEEMSYKHPTITASQPAPTLMMDEAQQLAKDLGATLVEYYRHAGGWCAFVVTPNSMQYVPLPGVDDNLLGRMFNWLGRIESRKGRGKLSYESLGRLRKALIAPLQPHLSPGEPVVLAPFAWLHLLPLGAALDPENGNYAADDYELAFAPSLAALRVTSDQARQNLPADQQMGGQLLSVAYPGAPESEHYLSNVVPEAEAVASHFGQVTRLYEDAATPDEVLAHARGQDVLHMSGHGWFDSEAPQQSGLMLSGGWLTVQRIIAELHLDHTRLATVSACLGARAEVRRAEEHVGLLQSMLIAGARAVVAGLWSVDDTSTRAVFDAFYTRVAAGASPAGALAKAAELVRSYPGWEHPYYWAAFQANGLAHRTNGSGLTEWPEDMVGQVEEMYHAAIGSIPRGGGSLVSVEETAQDSHILLEQISEEPEAVLAALDPPIRDTVIVELDVLAERADKVKTEADLLNMADAIHRLVEETPALAALLLPRGMDVEAAQEQRKITLDYHEATSSESQYAQEHAAQIRNHVLECRQALEQALQEASQAKSKNDP